MLNLHGISRASFDLIVACEVTSQAVYQRKYRRTEWPGEQSGVTIGIGYDVGQTSRSRFRGDWNGKLPEAMLAALEKTCGIHGPAAAPLARKLQNIVDVPWDVALDVFSNSSIPQYLALCRRSLPGFTDLAPDCQGALLSLVFNRGASFTKGGDRYLEMRAIRACMKSGNLAGIPKQLRSMRRLWPNARGLRERRDAEAALFERGLASLHRGFMAAAEPVESDETAMPEGEGRPAREYPGYDDQEPDADTIMMVQARLKKLGYFDIGRPDGDLQHRTEGAILAFRNEHGLPLKQTIDDEFLTELAKAGPREVGEERSTATAEDLRDQGSETIRFTDKAKRWAGRAFGFGAGGGFLASATDYMSSIAGFKEAVEGLGLSVKAVVILGMIAIACVILAGAGLAIWYVAHKIEQRRVADYRKGKNT